MYTHTLIHRLDAYLSAAWPAVAHSVCPLTPDASGSLTAQCSVDPQAGSRIDPMYSNPFFHQNTSALEKTQLQKKTKEETDISQYRASVVFFSSSFSL